jgi:cullin 3
MRALVEMDGSGLVPMLEGDRYEDLGRMYSLLRRVDGGLQLMRTAMGDHVKAAGRALVSDAERLRDPVAWVQRLLEERDKYELILARGLADDRTFRNALNAAFEHFVNLAPRGPEYLSLFVDDKLRRGLKGATDADVEAVLDKAMALFRYLQEKDVFEKYYKQHLAKRLLGGRTVSDDAERGMLVKLKTECGYQFTSKLEGMFTDMRTSRCALVVVVLRGIVWGVWGRWGSCHGQRGVLRHTRNAFRGPHTQNSPPLLYAATRSPTSARAWPRAASTSAWS